MLRALILRGSQIMFVSGGYHLLIGHCAVQAVILGDEHMVINLIRMERRRIMV